MIESSFGCEYNSSAGEKFMLMCKGALDFFVWLLGDLPLPGDISQKFKHIVDAIVAQNRNGEVLSKI